jgi:hypothetical protein
MRTILSGLMATAIAATAAFAMTAPAKADRLVYYGDSGRVYRAYDSDWRWHRWHRHHRPYVRYYSGYDPYYYGSYHAFGPYYDGPYYPRYYGWRHYHRPGFSIQFGF